MAHSKPDPVGKSENLSVFILSSNSVPGPPRGPRGTGLLNEAEAAALWLDELRAFDVCHLAVWP